MDEVVEAELYEAVAGLGNWHEVGERQQYLVKKDECVSCLRDLHYVLSQNQGNDQAGSASSSTLRLKLGEWKVLPNHLVPLFTSYREDPEIASTVLKVLVQLTTRCYSAANQLRHLEHLQDYKEAFAEKDVFIILMGMLVENMEEEVPEGETAKPNSKEVFSGVFALLRNLVSVPDPCPGDGGFTPMRKNLQLVYIKHFHEEGVLDFFLLFAESLSQDQDETQKAWDLADILYHICTHVSPEELMQGNKEKDKSVLKDLLQQEDILKSVVKVKGPSRHSRFGTVLMSTNSTSGAVHISTSVGETEQVSKGGRLWLREFRDPEARNDKKRNAFHDPFFVDLEEGSVRDHNALNPHIRNNLDSAKSVGDAVLAGLKKFFEEFVQTSFSMLISVLRSTLGHGAKALNQSGRDLEFDRPKMMNFLAWFLEYHRHHHASQLAAAKKSGEAAPVIDIASVQGAIDLDMIQFTTARLRQYGKECGIHASHLVIVLRALLQQVKTIDVVMDSKDQDTRDCGEILTQNVVKDDVMGHLAWIMKNYKSSSHDPRIMSYAVEVFHYSLRLMKCLSERKGQKLEFQVETGRGRKVTTTESEIASLADAVTVENLFHLLEKYKRHSPSLNSMLVKLIYQIIRGQPSNIVVFFELSYFLRINRMWADPILRDRKAGRRYQEMVQLLQYILRQFFKCAEKNKLVFVELLFRKLPERGKNALLESHTSEFSAILDNYENEDYKRLFDRMEAGESLDAMRVRQRAAMDGSLPWTDEEDEVLRQRFHMYADHPLCAELLAAELPEDSHRTARLVKKRLQELGLMAGGSRKAAPEGDLDGVDLDGLEPAKKKPRLDENGMRLDGVPASPDVGNLGGEVDPDENMLEADLERLLDAAMDADADAWAGARARSDEDGAVGRRAGTGEEGDASPGSELDLEEALEAMLEEEEGAARGPAAGSAEPPAEPPTEVATETAPASETQQSQENGGSFVDMERELASMLGAAQAPAAEARPTPPTQQQPDSLEATQEATQEASQLEDAFCLENELGAMMATGASQSQVSPSKASQGVRLTQVARPLTASSAKSRSLFAGEEEGEDEDARRFWEDTVQDRGAGDAAATAPCSDEAAELELELEKMLDEHGEGAAEEQNEY
mmetsp:Transcript_68643/g.201476  ORF Transcript_68643/g.201476 Transcript_68643/m.201476 type:complete len:1132 (-) Transcript_68643:38-3433(-)